MLSCRLSDMYLKEVFVIGLAKMWGQSSPVGHDHLSQELAQWLRASTALAEFQWLNSRGTLLLHSFLFVFVFKVKTSYLQSIFVGS